MNLTRMHLNVRRVGARKLIASPHAMHAAVMAGFPPGVAPGRALWRLDGADQLHPTLLVVSADAPDFTHLEEQAGWPSQPTTKSIAYEGLLNALEEGQDWAFRTTVNPTHRGRRDGHAKVFAHVTADQQTQWLLERQSRMGVSLVGDDGVPRFSMQGRDVKRFGRAGATVTLGTATFGGVLRVKDPEALRGVLTEGLGRGKAYGCGLLTLARL